MFKELFTEAKLQMTSKILIDADDEPDDEVYDAFLNMSVKN